ncbi:MAG TPA: glycosyltransferase family 39 protein [Candidatus Acidoferrales bacterium]|nr:glycosyltransferase family 39 protein [Candidatus Acidoferrales bacterium]
MHWLQSVDTALFHFGNRTLSNPFFDWLMPILSGHGVPWLLAVVLAVPLVFLFGSTRLRLCALLMVLVVALGDPLVIGTLKDSVQRPRPFVTIPDARLFGETGKGYLPPLADGSLAPTANRHSFPSAHSANWFAMATIAFLYYQRSARFMFPLAAAVAFSRVYNGVHYPSDVAAGAILGSGYAIAFVVLAQMLWSFIGKKVFPGWHAQLPNLLRVDCGVRSAELAGPKVRASNSELDWLRLGYLLIILALVGRWIYLASGLIGLSEDEAYQWLWSKHLALSYYSKSPGIAYIQWAGSTLFGDTDFGVRFFSPLFAAILSALVLRFMAREAGVRAAFCLLLINFATPLLVVGSILLTIDPPMVLCWMWAVVAGWRAVQPNARTHDWLVVGLAMGLGFLCKYTAGFQIICWAIFFALQPSARGHLRKPGPWLGLLVFGLCTLPVIIWNAQHGWITALHVWGDAGMTGHSNEKLTWLEHLRMSLNYFAEFTGGEFGALNPIFFIGALWAMAATWKRRADKPLWLLLFCMSAPVFLGHWLFSFHSRVQINWIAAAVPPMFCLMVLYWSESKLRVKPWLVAGVLLGVGASVFIYSSDLIGRLAGSKLPGDVDFSHRLRGWRETAGAVETERAQFDTNAFILADHYGTTGLYSFYSPPARAAAESGQPLVYCLDSDQPINQFPFWDEYNYREHRRGDNALFVLRLDPYKLQNGWIWRWLLGERVHFREVPAPRAVPRRVAEEFESVTNLGVREIKLRDGRVFQRVEFFGCYHLK